MLGPFFNVSCQMFGSFLGHFQVNYVKGLKIDIEHKTLPDDLI